MPITGLSIPTLNDLLGLMQDTTGNAAAGTDSFLSLLNAGINSIDATQSGNVQQDAQLMQTLPAPVQMPQANAPTVAPAPDVQNNQAAVTDAASQLVDDTNAGDDNTDNDTTTTDSSSHTGADSHASNDNQDSNAVSTNTNTSSQADASASSGQSGNGAPHAHKRFHADLQDQLANISQVVAQIIQGLSTNTTATAAATTGTQTDASATALTTAATTGPVTPGSVITPQELKSLALNGLSTSATADTDSTLASTAGATDSSSELSLLTDIQSVLQQLQQTLQPSTTTSDSAAAAQLPEQTATTATSTTSTAAIQTLADALASGVSKLTQFLQQQSNSTNTNTQASTPLATDDTDSLQSSILQIKNQLQKLKTDNAAIVTQATNNTTQPTPSDPSLNTLLTTKDTQINTAPSNNAAATSSNDAAASAQAGQAAPVVLPLPNQLFMLQTAAMLDMSQNNANSNTGGDTSQNQGQNQTLAQPITAASTSSSPVSNTVSTTFSRLLDQVSPSNVREQVMFNVKTAVSDGSSTIHIQLDPAELGKLDIKLNVGADGKTGVVITADNQNTLNILKNDTQGLTRALNDAGLQTDSGSLSFNLGSGQQQQAQGQTSPQVTATYQKAQPDDSQDISTTVISRSYVMNVTDGLDITI